MTKPTPEQFGITTELVESLTGERAQRDQWRERLCVVPSIGLCVVAGVSLYASNLSWKGSLSIFDIFGILFTVAWIVGLGFGA